MSVLLGRPYFGSNCEGEKGECGERGKRGKRGERGERGEKGEKGERGHDGKDGRDGHTGPTGPTGPQGLTGATGATGLTGPTGPAPDIVVIGAGGLLKFSGSLARDDGAIEETFLADEGFDPFAPTPNPRPGIRYPVAAPRTLVNFCTNLQIDQLPEPNGAITLAVLVDGFLTLPELTVNYTTGELVVGDNIKCAFGLVPVAPEQVIDVLVTTSNVSGVSRLDASATIGIQ